jgi:mono/diheme cytochrome c family protein
LIRQAFTIAAIVAATAIYGLAQAPQGAPAPAAGAGQQAPPAGGGRQGPPPQGRGGGMLGGAGPADKPVVDPAAADRGRKVWASECITCHGTQARGTDNGPNLVRSVVVLRDRYGSTLGPYLEKGHSMQSGRPSAALTAPEIEDLAHFLRQRVNDGLRGSPLFQPQNVLTGDPKAGAAFFTGEGKCATCHSATGDLAGIGGRYEPIDIQQRFLFPGTGRGGRGRGRAGGAGAPAVRVTVTPPGGQAISGVLVQMDDFFVTLRKTDGAVQTLRRGPGTAVEKNDPLAFHVELLDRLTDKNMHDVVAYLETLK